MNTVRILTKFGFFSSFPPLFAKVNMEAMFVSTNSK